MAWPALLEAGASALPAIANLASLPMRVHESRQAKREEERRYQEELAREMDRQKQADAQSQQAQEYQRMIAMMQAGRQSQDRSNEYGKLMALRQYGGRV